MSADQSIVGHLEDPAPRHPCLLRQSPGSPSCLRGAEWRRKCRSNVKLGGDDLAGLADLKVIGRIASIDSRSRSTNRCTELIPEVPDIC